MTFDYQLTNQAVEQVKSALQQGLQVKQLDIGLVLGSGFSSVGAVFEAKLKLPFSEVRGLGKATTAGHQGLILYSESFGMRSLIFSGRRHYYEGAGWTPVIIPMAVLSAMGAKAVVLTSATGGISANLRVGDLMLIEDHINFVGSNPLAGVAPHFEGMPQFPDQSQLYSRDMAGLAEEISNKCDLRLVRGVLAAMSGPSYETPAEIRMLKHCGADAVGMSLAAEAIVANAFGMRVLGLSAITNLAAGISRENLTHDEVLHNMALLEPKLQRFIAVLWEALRRHAAETHNK